MTGSFLMRWPNRTGAVVFFVALIAFAAGFVRSPVIDDVYAQERVVINKHARRAHVDVVRELALAQAYWHRNPDVAQDGFFGVDGALGTFGAREHYDRHGRLEGRRWGL